MRVINSPQFAPEPYITSEREIKSESENSFDQASIFVAMGNKRNCSSPPNHNIYTAKDVIGSSTFLVLYLV